MKDRQLISDFKDFYRRRVPYVKGAAAENSMDCSGAFVVAFKRHGQYIFHGSNTIARKHVSGPLSPIDCARPGWAIFKWKEANESMPAQYRHDGIGDLYHIGLLGADGVSVYNAKGTNYGFCIEPLSKWQYAAPLKGVEYEGDEEMDVLYRATVVTQNDPLRIRETPVTGKTLGYVPKGEKVEVLREGDWPYVRYGVLTGYVSGGYLLRTCEDEGNAYDGADKPAGGKAVTISRELAAQLYGVLGEQLSSD